MESSSVKEALEWLDDLYENLPRQKSGEEFLNQMEWHIRRYNVELQAAIREALGIWLSGDHSEKVVYAIELIDRLSATEYIPELEKIRDELRSGTSRWPTLWLSFVEAVIDDLRKAEEKKSTKEKGDST
ncbi:MAG: hypothetical protein IBX64_14005 [Actinobacteria bacterium]|nr:hypothetical protein [Actinomycetota bacterium]